MKNLFDLSGKVALVTGASSGLGSQMVKVLAKNGADVALVDLKDNQELFNEIEKIGRKPYFYLCDVSDVEQIKQAVVTIENHFGKIDILCNNAGISQKDKAENQSDEIWSTMMAINLSSHYYFSREVGRGMVKRRYGKIIMTASIHAKVGMMETPLSAYCTSKGGIEMMTKQLAVEWAKYGITVNAIGPAYFPSALTAEVFSRDSFQDIIKTRCPMGRTGREGELDGAVLYFASDASSYTTGQLLCIDGGWTAI